MPSSRLSQNSVWGVTSGLLPKWGPIALVVPLVIPAAAGLNPLGETSINLHDEISVGAIDFIQCVFIDNTNGAADLTLTVTLTSQKVLCQAGQQGVFSLFVPAGGTRIVADGAPGSSYNLIFSNVPLQPSIYQAAAAAPVQTPWTPANLAGANAWFDILGDIVTGGLAVESWIDDINSIEMQQPTASKQPAYNAMDFGGLGGIDFTGGTQNLFVSSGLPSTILPVTLAFVAEIPSYAAVTDLIVSNVNGGLQLYTSTGGMLSLAEQGTTTIESNAGSLGTAAQPVLIVVMVTATNVTTRVNGAQVYTVAHTTTLTGAGQLAVGYGNHAPKFSLGDVVQAGSTVLADQQRLEGYLAHKFGVTLPTTHPYYANPPYVS